MICRSEKKHRVTVVTLKGVFWLTFLPWSASVTVVTRAVTAKLKNLLAQKVGVRNTSYALPLRAFPNMPGNGAKRNNAQPYTMGCYAEGVSPRLCADELHTYHHGQMKRNYLSARVVMDCCGLRGGGVIILG